MPMRLRPSLGHQAIFNKNSFIFMISEYGREKRARRQSLLGQTTRRSLAVCMNADGGWGFGYLGIWVSGYRCIWKNWGSAGSWRLQETTSSSLADRSPLRGLLKFAWQTQTHPSITRSQTPVRVRLTFLFAVAVSSCCKLVRSPQFHF